MDLDEFRSILSRSRVCIWALIDTAVKVASSDRGDELRLRRDKIVQSLYAPATCRRCYGELREYDNDVVQGQNCHPQSKNGNDGNNNRDIDNYSNDDNDKTKRNNDSRRIGDSNYRNLNEDLSNSPLTPESNHNDTSGGEDELDPFGGLFDDEQATILGIKEQLEDPQQTEDSLVDLLQSLADMDITFQALKETDIGRPVNRLRKHSSNEVRRLVKQLVRKWKETVDEWVKVNQPHATSDLIECEESPQKNTPKNQQNSHQQMGIQVQRGIELIMKQRLRQLNLCLGEILLHLDHHHQFIYKPASAPLPTRVKLEPLIDDERLNSARRAASGELPRR